MSLIRISKYVDRLVLILKIDCLHRYFMNKISVTIITKNEEKNIRRCLKSIQWADEIVIVDTFSSDRTVEICREFTDKVFQESWLGYGRRKIFVLQRQLIDGC